MRGRGLTLLYFFSFSGIEVDYIHNKISIDGKPMQLDVYLPSLQLAFEYQGIQQISGSQEKELVSVCLEKQNEPVYGPH